MKVIKALAATVISAALLFVSACYVGPEAANLGGGSEGNPKTTYSLVLHTNGGIIDEEDNITSFEAGAEVILPVPYWEDDTHSFIGWYDNKDFKGAFQIKINAVDATRDMEFWAQWKEEKTEPPAPATHSVTLHLNGGAFVDSASNITSYTEGTAVDLPTAEEMILSGSEFKGWYDNKYFQGNAVTRIPANATGDKNYYAKWQPIAVEPPVETVYDVTFKYYNGTSDEVKKVKSGDMVVKPNDPQKTGHEFKGWFTDVTGGSEYNFSQGVTGNLTLHARWLANTYTISYELFGGAITGTPVNGYTYGVGATLPTQVEKEGNTFGGWFESEECNGDRIYEISDTDIGNKKFYAKWTPDAPVTGKPINITACGGYEESAFVEFEPVEGVTELSEYSVSYSGKSRGVLDSKSGIIRETDGKIRVDLMGLVSGNYTITVAAAGKTATTESIAVASYDRSGYAHFYKDNIAEIGAYDYYDGSLRSGAEVFYFSEENKNDDVSYNGKTYKGIVGLLKNATDFKVPLVVRIVGTISAATWNELKYEKPAGGNLSADAVKGVNGKNLPTDRKDITQEELISGGFNTLNTDPAKGGCSELLGLDSKAVYDSGKKEYDSAWNNCIIKNASNVTLEGVGTDARLFQWGLTWKNCNHIEVRNLTFEDYPEDACSFEGDKFNGNEPQNLEEFNSTHIWVHNNTFLEGRNYWDVCPEQDKHEGDGATDFKRNAYVTLSYNHYYHNHKTGLIGGGDSQTTACVTFHHNFYEDNNSRLPLARQANMHMYNNYYKGSTGTNMSIRAGGYAFIEYCYFENAKIPIETQTKAGLKGVVKLYNCEFVNTVTGSEKSKYDLNTKDYNITVATDRNQEVASENAFCPSFENSSDNFYYDIDNNCTAVENMITDLSQLPELIKQCAGVHKALSD